jgi:hypothetical protein
MSRDIVYFDLETQRTAGDVGGWGNKHKMGISIASTYSTKLGRYKVFLEEEVDGLIDQLRKADLVVGFNHIGFDYEVLMAFTVLDLKEHLQSLDLMLDLEKRIGVKVKLDAVASATLGTGKTADGLDAIRWWQQGKISEIARYCCYDVKVTKCVHEYGVEHGQVKYIDRNGRLQTVSVDW